MQHPILTVSQALEQRHSVRMFTPRPVDFALLSLLLTQASRAPSAGNLQPWSVHVVGGAALEKLKADVAVKLRRTPSGEPAEFASYPSHLWEPLRSRRYLAGVQRYQAFGYENKDPAGLAELTERNYDLFGATTAVFFTLDKRCGAAQWADLGMFIMAFMLLAVQSGLDTCAQQSWGKFNLTVKQHLGMDDQHLLFCGMAIGYRDLDHAGANIVTQRAPLAEFTTFHS